VLPSHRKDARDLPRKLIAPLSESQAHPGHQAIRRHKERGRALFRKLAPAAGLADPAELSDQWALLTEGATITALVEDDRKAAKRARRAAERLLSSAMREPARKSS